MRRTSDEYKAVIFGQEVSVRWLDAHTIEQESLKLLTSAGVQCTAASMPVPVDDILESHLGFHLEIDDLRSTTGALGATYPCSRTVVIDQSLDPSEHPHLLGRYNFTLGHEIGHIHLHSKYLNGLDAPVGTQSSDVVSSSDVLECQANIFASTLLMPSVAVHTARTEAEIAVVRWASWRSHDSFEDLVVARLSRHFAVSRQAMRFRLDRLALPDSDQSTRNQVFWQSAIRKLAFLKSFPDARRQETY